jgi:hypothetical protein
MSTTTGEAYIELLHVTSTGSSTPIDERSSLPALRSSCVRHR